MSAIKVDFVAPSLLGGPYAYQISKNGFCLATRTGMTNVGAMWDQIKADLATALGSETASSGSINVQSN